MLPVTIQLPKDVAQTLLRIAESKADAYIQVDTLLVNVKNFTERPDGSGVVMLVEGVTEKTAMAEINALIKGHASNLNLPGGMVLSWLYNKMESYTSIAVDTAEGTMQDVTEIAKSRTPYIIGGLILGILGILWLRS